MKRTIIKLGLAACGVALFTAATALAQTPVPLPTNCVAWWRGESNMLDSAGVNHGSSLNGATYAPGKVGQAFRFGGTNAVMVPDAPALRFGTSDLTVEAWVKGDPTWPAGAFFTKELQQYPHPDIMFYQGTGKLQFSVTDCGTTGCGWLSPGKMPILSPDRIDDGQWHHIAGVRSASALGLYVDGQLVATLPQAPLNPDSSASVFLGAGVSDSFVVFNGWAGLLDELAIYNRALSSNEVAAIYAAGSAGKVVSSGTAPSITSQPQSRTNAFGTTATFTVTATGTAPLSYQWRKGGSPLANAGNVSGVNTNQLTITNVAFANAGSYDVVVSNLSGSVTSAPVATLTVTQAVAGVSLNGLARTYNGSAQVVTATTTPAGLAYTVTYNGSVAAPTNAGSYAVAATVTDPGYTGGTNGTLVIDKATQTITFGPLLAKVMGDPPFTLNASVGGVTLLSGYSSQNTSVAQVSGNTVTIMGIGSTLITATKAGDANHYAAPDVSQTLVVSGVGASITQPPVAQVVGVGGQATFTVTAAGTGPLHYQWYFNNVAIGGATDSSYTINNAAPGAVGTYRVMVWNASGTNTSAAVSLGLDALKMYAGVNAYGPVGSNYVVQFTTNLTAPVTWTPLQSFTIVTNPTVIIDYNSPEQPKRFYRTLPQ